MQIRVPPTKNRMCIAKCKICGAILEAEEWELVIAIKGDNLRFNQETCIACNKGQVIFEIEKITEQEDTEEPKFLV